MNYSKILLLLLVNFSLLIDSHAQFLRATVGTDIPMQYLVGLNYQQGNFASAEMSIGYVGYPYNGDLYKVISVPEQFQARKEFLMETTDDGFVWGMGINGHFKKWYGGVFVQRLELHASATYKYIIGSELFQEEISPEDRQLLNAFLDANYDIAGVANVNLDNQMRLNTVAWQGGLKIGRRFFFKNKRWEFRAEIALSKNLSAVTESDYDNELFNQVKREYGFLQQYAKSNPEEFKQLEADLGITIPLDVDLDNILDFETKEREIDEWFHKYAYIPTLNFHITYLLNLPDKLKDKEQEVLELKQE